MFRPLYPAALVLFLAATPSFAQQDVITLKSPDGRIEFRLLDGAPWDTALPYPHLSYQVDFNGKRLIDTSHLGYEIDSALPLGHKLGLMDVTSETVDETYSLPSGKAKTIRNHYNEVVAEYLQNGSLGRRLNIEARAYNDGVAFRYVIPQTLNLENFRSPNEITEFVFAKDGDTYPLLLSGFQTAYEDQYSKLALSRIHPDSLVALPFLVQQPGVGWIAVTEADLDDYAGLYLEHGEDRLMRARLSPRVDGSGLALQAKTPVVSPWRVMLIADAPTKLIESNIVTSLNRATKLKDTSWIQPGKAVSARTMTTAAVKSTIDFAGASGLEYVMIENGLAPIGNGNVPDLMRTIPGVDMPALLAQAKQRKVGLWLATNWRSVESQMEEAFAQFEKWGIRGVKIDGMNRDDAAMVAFYHQAAAKAAEHHLMVDFHGAYKPDGMQRTYPNVLTTEAVMGSEYSKTSAAVTPEHNVTLAFTRMLAGPMDYAPGSFNNATREQFQPGASLGTRAHQLALSVIFESGLQTLPDPPESYKGNDFDFLKSVPATWDETRALSGEVSEYVAIARSHGQDWYLGAITNWTPRELDVPLTFLGPGTYLAEIHSDSGSEQRPVTAATVLHLKLASGGGTAIHFTPRNTSP